MIQHAFMDSELGVTTLQRVANPFGMCRSSDVGDPCARTCVMYKHRSQHLNQYLTRIRIDVRRHATMSYDNFGSSVRIGSRGASGERGADEIQPQPPRCARCVGCTDDYIGNIAPVLSNL